MLGKVAGPYGVQGWIRVYPEADDPMDWAELPVWWLSRDPEQPIDQWASHRLLACRTHASALIARLEGFQDRTDAEALKGFWVGAPREALPNLAEGEFYWADLLGLKVLNTQGELLGHVDSLIETGANDVLKVISPDGKSCLIPYVDVVVEQVDVLGGEIRVVWEKDW